MKAYVAHNGGGHLVSGKSALRLKHLGTDCDSLVAVNHSSLFIGHYESVCIAIKGQTHKRTFLYHPFLKLFGMGGTASVIDVYAVWAVADGDDLSSQSLIYTAGNLIGCSVGAVKNHLFAVKTKIGSLNQVLSVKLCRAFLGLKALAYKVSGNVAVDIYAADDYILNFFLDKVIEFEALRVKKLYSVVFKGVMGCADDNAGVGLIISGQKSNRRCGNNACLDYISSHSQNSCGQSVFKHISGHSGVLADNDGRSFAFPAEHEGPRLSQIKSQFRGQFLIGDTSYSIGPEKSSHGFTSILQSVFIIL